MGSTLVRKWGRRPDFKKEETEVEICGTLLEEESFLCHVLPSLHANISIWNIVRCTLQKIFTRMVIQL